MSQVASYSSFSERNTYGLQKEKELKPRIEEAIGETITKTECLTATYDFVTENYNIELKSRRAHRYNRFNGTNTVVGPETDATWLMPTCKEPKDDKTTLFFYHFQSDDSLWYCEYTKEDAKNWDRAIPSFSPTNQEHWYIPRTYWSRIE